MIIRRAGLKDAEKIVEFDQKLRSLHQELADSHIIVVRGINGVTKRLKNYFVAEIDSEVVGAVYCKKVAGYLAISHLWVEEAFRERGVCSALIAAAVERAKTYSCTSIKLEVRDSNPVAKEVFSKAGFAPAGVIMYYDLPVDEGITE